MNPSPRLSAIGLLALVAAFSFLGALPRQGITHLTPLVITDPEGAYRLIYLSILGAPIVLLGLLLALRPRAEFALPIGLAAIVVGLAASGRSESLPVVLLASSFVSIGSALFTASALVLAVDRLPRRSLLSVVVVGFVAVLAGSRFRTWFESLPLATRQNLLLSGFVAAALVAALLFWPRPQSVGDGEEDEEDAVRAAPPVRDRTALPAVEIVRSLLVVAAAFLIASLLGLSPDPETRFLIETTTGRIVLPGIVLGGLLLLALRTGRTELGTAFRVLGAVLVLAGAVGTFFPDLQGASYDVAKALFPGVLSVVGLRFVVAGKRFRLARAYAPTFVQSAAGFLLSQTAESSLPSGLGRIGAFAGPLALVLLVLLVVPTTSREPGFG